MVSEPRKSKNQNKLQKVKRSCNKTKIKIKEKLQVVET